MPKQERTKNEACSRQDHESHATEIGQSGEGRRRFIKKAIVTAPVILTVASRPVWARNCTLSGMLSGNLSDDGPPCEGCSPGYWRNHYPWPGGYTREDRFKVVFGVGDSFFDDYPGGGTLGEIIDRYKPELRDPVKEVFAFHAIAGLLNSAFPGLEYGYDPPGLIAMVRSAYVTGDFESVKNDLDYLNNRGCPL